jgi:hypothetical protein
MRGASLYPLNVLRTRHADLYERERRKYVGREDLLRLTIPLLDVLWTDVVHLAPIHPWRLADAWRKAGLWSEVWEGRFFQIPVERIVGLRCIWFSSGALSPRERSSGIRQLEADGGELSWFRPAEYDELDQVPQRYETYLRECSRDARRARPFAHIPHVLVEGAIDVAGVPLVEASTR